LRRPQNSKYKSSKREIRRKKSEKISEEISSVALLSPACIMYKEMEKTFRIISIMKNTFLYDAVPLV
jgi:hypothetical protein